MFEALLRRIQIVKNFCSKHPDYKMPYPSFYFNPFYKKGFKQTEKWLKSSLDYQKFKEKLIGQ